MGSGLIKTKLWNDVRVTPLIILISYEGGNGDIVVRAGRHQHDRAARMNIT